MSSDFVRNPWILFLRKYGPIPRNDNMYDESIQRALRRSSIPPIAFEAPYLSELVENFQGDKPDSVVLTGTAGDGKTYLCRRVWEELGGEASVWQQDDKIRQLELPSGKTLTVIKDLSELREEINELLVQMAEAICGHNDAEVYLVAANDGQFIDAWSKAPDSVSVETVRQLIEDLLVTDEQRQEGHAFTLFNLSRTSAADMLGRILGAILNHPGWQNCSGCRGQLADQENRCPIWENYTRLQQDLFQERFRNLLELCDHNDHHLPIRQLLILVTNTLLGHPKAKERLLRCADVPDIVAANTVYLASPYSNVFGDNLTENRRESIEVFEVLNRFGVGEETTNRIDNMLIYGADDISLKPTFDTLVGADSTYGATDRYLTLQGAYLEGSDSDTIEEFLEVVRYQRQRLFFTMPDDYVLPMGLWDLTVFRFAGEYLHEVYAALRDGQRPSRHILVRLVRGMNRVLTGMLTATDRQIVLATAGSYSQARVSRIEEGVIEVEPHRGQWVALELRTNNRLDLVVHLDRNAAVPLPLHLIRYEFLSRVAEGALPSSFSRECYEDLLACKSRLLSEYRKVEQEFCGQEGLSPDELNLKLLELDGRGFLKSQPLEVQLG